MSKAHHTVRVQPAPLRAGWQWRCNDCHSGGIATSSEMAWDAAVAHMDATVHRCVPSETDVTVMRCTGCEWTFTVGLELFERPTVSEAIVAWNEAHEVM